MTRDQLDLIISTKAYPHASDEAIVVETHISLLILDEQVVYKFKKGVQFSFLDFSTLEKRHFYCEKELALNRRLAAEMYLEVVPVRRNKQGLCVGTEEGEIVDYGVKMRRLDNSRQMNLLLEQEKVTLPQLQQLAWQLARFHTHATRIKKDIAVEVMQRDFADILKLSDQVRTYWGPAAEKALIEAVDRSAVFLNKHSKRLQQRTEEGFVVDGHGDLHASNIFLTDPPVIFDCIEFNDHLRQIDVLNEIAFLCVDLDFFGFPDGANYFVKAYADQYPCMPDPVDHPILAYFRRYRANVRFKISLLECSATDSPGWKQLAAALRYGHLMGMEL